MKRLPATSKSSPKEKSVQHRIEVSKLNQNICYKLCLQASLIVLLTILVYIPAIQGGFVWDDDKHVTENLTLRTVEGLAQIWLQPHASPQYYPLVFSTFWVEYHLWGMDPLGYHVVNVLLHALSSVLLWLLLRRLKVPGAWLAAAVFALHPVHVESVAWVTERKNVLSGLFYFCSAHCLIRFFDVNGKGEDHPRKWWWFAAALLLFLCALLSKTVTCSLPAAMILVLWWKHGRVRWSEIAALVPFFLVGLVSGLFTAWLERHHVGAQGLEWELSFLERFLVAGRALWFYAGKLAWPVDLTFTYPHWQIDTTVWWQYAYPLAALVVVSLLWAYRGKVGRGPLVGVLYFCATLFPALGFFDVYPFRFSYVADHFQYLASVGLIGLAVGGLTHTVGGLPLWVTRTIAVFGFSFLTLLAAQTWRQGYIYENLETLWTDTLEKNPLSWHRHYDLATHMSWQGRVEEAISHYVEALRIKPDYADAHNNLGVVLAGQGKLEEAIRHQSEALRLKPRHPEAHYNLGLLLIGQGRVEEAIDHLFQHLMIRPDHADAHYNLGVLLGMQGRFQEAVRHFSETLRIKPDDASARHNLEITLRLLGKSPSEIED